MLGQTSSGCALSPLALTTQFATVQGSHRKQTGPSSAQSTQHLGLHRVTDPGLLKPLSDSPDTPTNIEKTLTSRVQPTPNDRRRESVYRSATQAPYRSKQSARSVSSRLASAGSGVLTGSGSNAPADAITSPLAIVNALSINSANTDVSRPITSRVPSPASFSGVRNSLLLSSSAFPTINSSALLSAAANNNGDNFVINNSSINAAGNNNDAPSATLAPVQTPQSEGRSAASTHNRQHANPTAAALALAAASGNSIIPFSQSTAIPVRVTDTSLISANAQLQQQITQLIKINEMLRLDLAVARNHTFTSSSLDDERKCRVLECAYNERGLEISELKRVVHEREERNQCVVEERDRLEGVLREKTHEWEEIQKESQEREQNLRSVVTELREQVNTLDNAKKLLQMRQQRVPIDPQVVFDLQQQVQELQTRLNVMTDARDEAVKAHANCGLNVLELLSLRRDMGDAKRVFAAHEDLQVVVDQMTAELEMSRNREKKLEKVLSERQTTTAEWQERLFGEQVKHAHCDDKINELSTRVGILERDKRELQKVLSEERTRMKSQVMMAQEDVKSVEERREHAEREVKMVHERVNLVNTENETLRQQIEVLKRDGDGRIERVVKMTQEITQLKTENMNKQQKIEELAQMIKSIENELKQSRIKATEMSAMAEREIQENIKREQRVIAIQSESNKAKTELDKKIREVERLTIKLDLTNKSHVKQRDAMEALESKLAANHEMANQLEEYKDKYVQTQGKFDRTFNELRQLQKTHNLVSDELRKITKLHSDLESKVMSVEMRNTQLEARLGDLSAEYASMKNDYLRVFAELMRKEKELLKEHLLNVDLALAKQHAEKLLAESGSHQSLYTQAIASLEQQLAAALQRCESLSDGAVIGVAVASHLASLTHHVTKAPVSVMIAHMSRVAHTLSLLGKGTALPDTHSLEWPEGYAPISAPTSVPVPATVPVPTSGTGISVGKPSRNASGVSDLESPDSKIAKIPGTGVSPPILGKGLSLPSRRASAPLLAPHGTRTGANTTSETGMSTGTDALITPPQSRAPSSTAGMGTGTLTSTTVTHADTHTLSLPELVVTTQHDPTSTSLFTPSLMRSVAQWLGKTLTYAADAIAQRDEVQKQLARVVRDYEVLLKQYRQCPKWDWRVQLQVMSQELANTNKALGKLRGDSESMDIPEITDTAGTDDGDNGDGDGDGDGDSASGAGTPTTASNATKRNLYVRLPVPQPRPPSTLTPAQEAAITSLHALRQALARVEHAEAHAAKVWAMQHGGVLREHMVKADGRVVVDMGDGKDDMPQYGYGKENGKYPVAATIPEISGLGAPGSAFSRWSLSRTAQTTVVDKSIKEAAEFALANSPLTPLNIQVNNLSTTLESYITTAAHIQTVLRGVNGALREGFAPAVAACRTASRAMRDAVGECAAFDGMCKEVVSLLRYCRDTNHMLGHTVRVLGRTSRVLNRASAVSLCTDYAATLTLRSDAEAAEDVGYEDVKVVEEDERKEKEEEEEEEEEADDVVVVGDVKMKKREAQRLAALKYGSGKLSGSADEDVFGALFGSGGNDSDGGGDGEDGEKEKAEVQRGEGKSRGRQLQRARTRTLTNITPTQHTQAENRSDKSEGKGGERGSTRMSHNSTVTHINTNTNTTTATTTTSTSTSSLTRERDLPHGFGAAREGGAEEQGPVLAPLESLRERTDAVMRRVTGRGKLGGGADVSRTPVSFSSSSSTSSSSSASALAVDGGSGGDGRGSGSVRAGDNGSGGDGAAMHDGDKVTINLIQHIHNTHNTLHMHTQHSRHHTRVDAVVTLRDVPLLRDQLLTVAQYPNSGAQLGPLATHVGSIVDATMYLLQRCRQQIQTGK